MSFRDLASSRSSSRPQRATPRIVVQPPATAEQTSVPLPMRRKTRRIVLHGKVQHVDCDDEDDGDNEIVEERETFRQRLQRRSDFSKLANETQQFQKLVADLSNLLDQAESGESPEATWRARILIRSAQETDKELWTKLLAYERTLDGRHPEARIAQTACMKLHRDFKRSHKTLVMVLSTYQKRQAAEVSLLGAVGWSDEVPRDEEKEDFFDRAMREREIRRMNQSMHQVNNIYKDLANLVDEQQDQIDKLEDDVQYARENVEAAEQEVNCLAYRDHFCGALDFEFGRSQWDPFPEFDNSIVIDETKSSDSHVIKPSPKSVLPNLQSLHWYTPFETFPEDLRAVKSDIVGLGKDIITKGKKFDCGA